MIRERIHRLQSLMKQNNIDAYYIPGSDAHQNEYLPDRWKRREWLSGFTGSYGYIAVTADRAILWTDSRYFLQAEEELKGTGIELFKLGTRDTPDVWEWLKEELTPGQCLGLDSKLITFKQSAHIKKLFHPRNIKIKYIETNLVDSLREKLPSFPLNPAVPYPEEFAGRSVEEKLDSLRVKLIREKCEVHVLTRLDSIAWLFNIRGSDIEYNPVVIAYAIVTLKDAKLFLYAEKITPGLWMHLKDSVELYDYDDFKKHLKFYKDNSVWVDDKSTSVWITENLKQGNLYFNASPVVYSKAVKNKIEIENMKKCHIRDGAAMVKFLKWLEESVPCGDVTEASAADKLEEIRRQNEKFMGLSFNTISGYKEHGAIVHYSHTDESSIPLKSEGLYLLDSGAQYLDGTTDITRTIALGIPSDEERECYTLVLKGHIDLAMAKFPEGTQGIQLDTIARKPLWDHGMDYGHGTGHGIGAYLNVHEGPHAVSLSKGAYVKLKEGMFFSNEPGFYKKGKFGIRIENVVYVKKEDPAREVSFCCLATISYCPFDLKLIKKELLNPRQIDFINAYHKQVREKLAPFLDDKIKAWLEKSARPI